MNDFQAIKVCWSVNLFFLCLLVNKVCRTSRWSAIFLSGDKQLDVFDQITTYPLSSGSCWSTLWAVSCGVKCVCVYVRRGGG